MTEGYRVPGHKGYLQKREWVCEKSPTGAHWWVGSFDSPDFECKYCHETRTFSNTMPHDKREIPPQKDGAKGKPGRLSRGASRKPYVKSA